MGVTMVVIAQLSPPEQRARRGGIGGLVAGFGLVVGPLVGGALAEHLSWRWIFYVNLPLGVLILATGAAVLRLPAPHRRHRLDYPGAALAAAFAVTLSLLLEWGGQRYPWTAPTTLGLAGAAAGLLAGFVWREAVAVEPILPLRLFATRAVALALPLQGLLALGMTGAIVYVIVYLQVVRGIAADHAGLYLLPVAVGMTAAGTVVGRLVARGTPIRIFMISGTSAAVLALGLLTLLRADTALPWLAAVLVLYGVGLGQAIGVLVMVVQNAAPPHQLGVATTALRLFQALGGALGAAIFGSVLSHAFAARYPLPGHPGVAALAGVPAADRPRALAAFVGALDAVFAGAALVMAVALALAILLWRTRPAPVPAPDSVAVPVAAQVPA